MPPRYHHIPADNAITISIDDCYKIKTVPIKRIINWLCLICTNYDRIENSIRTAFYLHWCYGFSLSYSSSLRNKKSLQPCLCGQEGVPGSLWWIFLQPEQRSLRMMIIYSFPQHGQKFLYTSFTKNTIFPFQLAENLIW